MRNAARNAAIAAASRAPVCPRQDRPSATNVTAVAVYECSADRRRTYGERGRTDGVDGESAGPGGGDGDGACAVGVVDDGGIPAVVGVADAVAVLLIPARCPVFRTSGV